MNELHGLWLAWHNMPWGTIWSSVWEGFCGGLIGGLFVILLTSGGSCG